MIALLVKKIDSLYSTKVPTADLVAFSEEILNGKHYFLYSVKNDLKETTEVFNNYKYCSDPPQLVPLRKIP